MNSKTLYALDFDGVICHSAIETAGTAWIAAQTLWPDMQGEVITESRIQDFLKMRPCLEYGYEATLIMRLLYQQTGMEEDCSNYQIQTQKLISDNGFNVEALQILFGRTRDSQIQQDEAAWLDNNPLFDGIAGKLKNLNTEDWIIITTKQERFVKKILQGHDIELADDRLFGLEKNLSKQTVLENLIEEYPNCPIIFIEDRLPTLLGVLKNPALESVKLQLVDWGYNTLNERELARQQNIEVIALGDFVADSETTGI